MMSRACTPVHFALLSASFGSPFSSIIPATAYRGSRSERRSHDMVLAVSNSVASGWFGGSGKEARVSLQDELRRNNDGQILFFFFFPLF